MSLNPSGININLSASQTSGGSNPTISNLNAGQTFDGRGNDFLSPNRILRNVDSFGGSIRPITSNTLTNQIAPTNLFGGNADPRRILTGTNSNIKSILSPNFGNNITFEVPVIPAPFIQPVPDLGVNPDPTKVVLSTLFFTQNVQAPTAINDPRNFNPLIWQNPNSINILLGSLQAQSAVLNGSGLAFPPFNPFPTQQVTQFPFNPFGSGFVQAPQQAVPVIPVIPVVPAAINFGAIGQPQLAGMGLQTSLFPHFTQPFSLPASQPVQPYQSQVGLMLTILNDLTSVMSHTMRQLVRTHASSDTSISSSGNSGAAGGAYAY